MEENNKQNHQVAPKNSGNSFKKEWIKNGFDREADKYAQQIGKELINKKLSSSQLRNIFGEIKNIQMRISNNDDFEKEKSRFILTKAKMAYAVGRQNSEALKDFREIFDKAHAEVTDKDTFDRFVAFITAILAYHRAEGGK